MLKTIIISITSIICTILICFTIYAYSNNNRYASFNEFNMPSILDHRTGKVYSINIDNEKIIITNFLENNITYFDYETFGNPSSLDWNKIQGIIPNNENNQ